MSSAPEPTRARASESRSAEESPAKPSSRVEEAAKTPARLNRNLQSGLLTAGSFDDIARFDSFRDFLSKTMQNDPRETYPRFAIGQRVVIEVVDGQGQPVGDARVVVQSSESAQANDRKSLLDLRTGSDGRVMLLTGMDGNSADGEFVVTVTPPNGDKSSTHTRSSDEATWKITLDAVEHAAPKQLDLALVIDTTGSMGDELEYLKVEIDSISAAIARMFPEVDQRYAVILYRDEGDEYVTRAFDFTDSLLTFRETLAEQSANGGGDYPEAMHLALEQAADLSWRERNTARVMFLVGDAPPHDQHAARAMSAAQRLREQGVRAYPIAGSGVAWQAEFIMRATSFLTMGQYLFLTDHSGVGNPHAKPHVPEYQVERLDRLMIRMIASELAGKRLAPAEVIAIERGDDSESGPPDPSAAPPAPVDPQAIDNPRPDAPAAEPPVPQGEASTESPSAGLTMSKSRWLFFALLLASVFAYDAFTDRRRNH
ncbi:MAG: VWA domain-containing protein [Pirellulaceae bacterium]